MASSRGPSPRAGWLLLLAILGFAVGCADCDNRILGTSADPSGPLEVVLMARTCGSASGVVASLRPKGAQRGAEIFQAMAPAGFAASRQSWSDAVKVEWVGPSRLVVTYTRALLPTLQVVKRGRAEVEFRPVDEPNSSS